MAENWKELITRNYMRDEITPLYRELNVSNWESGTSRKEMKEHK